MTSAPAEGMTETLATRFCTVSFTVTRRPFHSLAVSFAMSSPACMVGIGIRHVKGMHCLCDSHTAGGCSSCHREAQRCMTQAIAA